MHVPPVSILQQLVCSSKAFMVPQVEQGVFDEACSDLCQMCNILAHRMLRSLTTVSHDQGIDGLNLIPWHDQAVNAVSSVYVCVKDGIYLDVRELSITGCRLHMDVGMQVSNLVTPLDFRKDSFAVRVDGMSCTT